MVGGLPVALTFNTKLCILCILCILLLIKILFNLWC